MLRPSFHLYLLVCTLAIFFAQIPLGLFAAQSPLDSTAHVLLPAAATSLLYDALYSRVVHSSAQYFCTMWLLGVSAEMIWECIEFGADAALQLTWQADNADTMNDIMCGIVGAMCGAALRLWIWTRTRRRIHAARQAPAGEPRFYHGRGQRPGGRGFYRGLWVVGSAGGWCSHEHVTIADARRCAEARWWQQHRRVARPGGPFTASRVAPGRPLPWAPSGVGWSSGRPFRERG